MALCVRPRMIGCGAHSGLMGGCASVMFCVTARRMMCVQKDGLACGVVLRVLVRHVVRVYMLCHRRNQLPIGVRIRLLVGEGDRVRDQNSRAPDSLLTLRDSTWLALREGVREIAV